MTVAVDGYCLGNPGKGGYKGIILSKDGNKQFFIKHISGKTTNNITEYLAIVHAIAECEKLGEKNFTIYTDSKTAITWIENRRANTNLPLDFKTAESHTLLNRANDYIKEKACFSNFRILFWNKKQKGENPADFGNK